MNERILVAYATKYGATTEIAERIGQTLREAGLQTDVQLVQDVDDLTPYEAVVVGSAVYMGSWRKEAAKFLRDNEKALASRPVWLFSSGPMEEGDPVEKLQGWTFPSKLQPIADRIQPRAIAVFHGAVNLEKMNSLERWMFNHSKSPTGDFRDWDAIDAWAAGIADEMKAQR